VCHSLVRAEIVPSSSTGSGHAGSRVACDRGSRHHPATDPLADPLPAFGGFVRSDPVLLDSYTEPGVRWPPQEHQGSGKACAHSLEERIKQSSYSVPSDVLTYPRTRSSYLPRPDRELRTHASQFRVFPTGKPADLRALMRITLSHERLPGESPATGRWWRFDTTDRTDDVPWYSNHAVQWDSVQTAQSPQHTAHPYRYCAHPRNEDIASLSPPFTRSFAPATLPEAQSRGRPRPTGVPLCVLVCPLYILS